MTSCQDENESLRTDAKLIQSLRVDVEFQDFFSEARTVQFLIAKKLIQLNSNEDLNNIRNSANLYEASNYLGLSNDFLFKLNNKSKNILNIIKNRYPEFNTKTKKELNSIVDASIPSANHADDLVLSTLRSGRVMDGCDDQFKADFNRIHNSFDTGVKVCLVVALSTMGEGLIPCNAANVYRTLTELAEAVDDHTTCKQNLSIGL